MAFRKRQRDRVPPGLMAILAGHGRPVNAVGFSPDGRLLVSGGADRAVILWDVTDPAHPALRASLAHPRPGKLASAARTHNGVSAAGFSPDGRLLACTSGKTVVVWDIADPAHPRQRAAITHRPRHVLTAAGFSPDGKLLATAATARKDTAILWDATDLDHPARLASLQDGVSGQPARPRARLPR